MNIRRHSLNILLALVLAFASVLSANHVHADEHATGEQVEQCLAYHQLHFDGHPQHEHFEVTQKVEVHHGAIVYVAQSRNTRLYPPARAPPLVS